LHRNDSITKESLVIGRGSLSCGPETPQQTTKDTSDERDHGCSVEEDGSDPRQMLLFRFYFSPERTECSTDAQKFFVALFMGIGTVITGVIVDTLVPIPFAPAPLLIPTT